MDHPFTLPRFVVAGPHRSAGKTTVCIGLARALKRRGLVVQPFKKGPDYIDPMWLSAAAGRQCRSLDFHMMGPDNIARSLQTAGSGAGIGLIEGNQGLFDGLDLEGSDSSAALAHLAKAPVVFVMDTSRMNRGVAPILLGYKNFDPDLNFAGVILNKVGNPRHEEKLLKAVERYVGLPVIGVVPKAPEEMGVTERHLGLIPVKEDPALEQKIDAIADTIERSVNLDALVDIAKSAPPLAKVSPCERPTGTGDVPIGIADDRVFTFYYPENLEALEAAGARLVPFSPLADEKLPDVVALYLGGGFPEVMMDQLAANASLRAEIRAKGEAGMPIYAECGGFMYLARSIIWGERRAEMCGLLPVDIEMTERPMGLGYMKMTPTGACAWTPDSGEVRCHEFHHSRVTNVDPGALFAWNVTRGSGMSEGRDGMIYKNTLASYAHLHHCGASWWAKSFVALAKKSGETG